jgi:predicted lysophospholipase L1 biosynthesis ABC-type transport system permease subunit
MGLSLLAGRDISASDDASSSPVVMVNEALALRIWPGMDALGQVLQVDSDPRTVVGVVRGTRYLTPEQEPGPEVFVPIRQLPVPWVDATYMVVRGPRPPAALASAVGGALRSLDAGLPVNDIVVIQELLDRALSPRRLLAMLLVGFAGFALALASLGIYGVIAYSVRQRRQEIGVRMALGASAREVRGRVLQETLELAVAGLIVGLPGAWILGRLMQGLLFGVAPADPLTFVAVPLVLLSVAGLAGYLPAASAARLDPARVLSDSG